MEKELHKNEQKTLKEGDAKGDLGNQKDGIVSYIGEIQGLLEQVDDLKAEKDECFQEFDVDIPRPVKEERVARQSVADVASPKGRKSVKPKTPADYGEEKPTDMYYMLSVNCKYRKRIHQMLKDLRNINQRRKDLESKYAPLKRDLQKVTQHKLYKAIKGDDIDELFAHHLNKA